MIFVTPCSPDDFPINDNLFQSAFWGMFKTMQGQKALYFFVEYAPTQESAIQFPLVLLLRSAKNKRIYAYAPKAPAILVPEDEQGIFLEQLAMAVKNYLPSDCICIRFDLAWERSEYNSTIRPELRELRMNYGTDNGMLRKSPLNHLCPDTVIINLTYSPEQLLAKMRQTTRNSIRRAYKSNVTFMHYTAEEALLKNDEPTAISPLEEYHRVYKETALRKQFYFEEYDYFRELFMLSTKAQQHYCSSSTASGTPPLVAIVPQPTFYLFTASKDGTLLSGLILGICGHTAYYLYAGSTLEGRELMPNYGLQWEAQLFARRCGCTKYDLMGIPPNNNKAHPMAGLFVFKTGFGGDTKHFSGAWDYILDEQTYVSFTTEEQFSFHTTV